MRRTSLPLVVTFGVLAALSSACTRAQARVNPDVAPLDVPAPPPRNVEATEEPPPLPATATEETPRAITPRPRLPTTPAQQRPEPARPEPARVEPVAPVEPARPADDTRGQPPATLQTTPAEREAHVRPPASIGSITARSIPTRRRSTTRPCVSSARRAKRFAIETSSLRITWPTRHSRSRLSYRAGSHARLAPRLLVNGATSFFPPPAGRKNAPPIPLPEREAVARQPPARLYGVSSEAPAASVTCLKSSSRMARRGNSRQPAVPHWVVRNITRQNPLNPSAPSSGVSKSIHP